MGTGEQRQKRGDGEGELHVGNGSVFVDELLL